jgi:Zn-dependent protease with chaperone function
MLSSHTILTLAGFACLTGSCVAAEPYADVLEHINHIGPLPLIAADLKRQVIASLPREGEVALSPQERKKLESVTPVLKLHGRDTDYLFKVFDSAQARIAVYARFVVLVTNTALRLLTPGQLQAVVAHEIGHEYVWEEYEDARNRHDWRRVRELELFCDAVALKTLIRTGTPPSALIDALRTMTASNERNGIVPDTRDSHPSLVERARFSEELVKRLSLNVDR